MLYRLRDLHTLPGVRHFVQWCIVPVEMYVGFGMSVVLGVGFATPSLLDWRLLAAIGVYATALTAYRNHVVAQSPELTEGIPRWWRWLWRGVIIANIAVYFVWANLR